jgi:hypothetical protein
VYQYDSLLIWRNNYFKQNFLQKKALMSLQSREILAPSRSSSSKHHGQAEDIGASLNREPASMNKIEEYLELMYEEGKGKVVGTANILELASSVSVCV